MKTKYLHFLKTLLVAILAFNVLGAGVMAILSMDHQGSGQPCFDVSSSSTGSNGCLDYHLGIMHELSQAVFWNFFAILFVIVLMVFYRSAFGVGQIAANDLSYFRSRLKLSIQESLTFFYKQLGNWLAIFEKRDIANTTASVQVGFGMP